MLGFVRCEASHGSDRNVGNYDHKIRKRIASNPGASEALYTSLVYGGYAATDNR